MCFTFLGLECTTLGRIASFYYLSHETVSLFREGLGPTTDLEEILKLLCDCHEYAELPVRERFGDLSSF